MGNDVRTGVLAAAALAGLIGCASTPSPPTPPELVYSCALPEQIPELPPWALERVEVLGLQGVADLGGTNQDLFYVSVRDSEAAIACNTKLEQAENYINELLRIIDVGRNQPR